MTLLTPREAGDQLKVTHWTINRMIKNGELPAVAIHAGKRTTYRIRAELLERWIMTRERTAKHTTQQPKRRTETKRPAKFDDVLTGDSDRSQVPEISARAHAGLSSDGPSGGCN